MMEKIVAMMKMSQNVLYLWDMFIVCSRSANDRWRYAEKSSIRF